MNKNKDILVGSVNSVVAGVGETQPFESLAVISYDPADNNSTRGVVY